MPYIETWRDFVAYKVDILLERRTMKLPYGELVYRLYKLVRPVYRRVIHPEEYR
jgi:hypothetical protein